MQQWEPDSHDFGIAGVLTGSVLIGLTAIFFLAEQGTPGRIVEHGTTAAMFGAPADPRTADYIHGRFG